MLSSVDPTFKYFFCLHANEMLLRLEHTPKLVIAAINGTLRRRRTRDRHGGRLSASARQDAREDRTAGSEPRACCLGTAEPSASRVWWASRKAIELMVVGNTFSFEGSQRNGHHQRYLRAR